MWKNSDWPARGRDGMCFFFNSLLTRNRGNANCFQLRVECSVRPSEISERLKKSWLSGECRKFARSKATSIRSRLAYCRTQSYSAVKTGVPVTLTGASYGISSFWPFGIPRTGMVEGQERESFPRRRNGTMEDHQDEVLTYSRKSLPGELLNRSSRFMDGRRA